MARRQTKKNEPEELILPGSLSNGLGDADPNVLEIKAGKKISICIPYLAKAAQGIELLMTLRSIAKNFHEDFQVVIIGDRPDWISDDVIHIDAPCVSKNPQVDVINKIKMAIADERVSDSFIWTNDDIYFVSPVMLSDIQFLTAHGVLEKTEPAKTKYQANKNRTIDLLKSFNLSNFNYSTHTPFFFEKIKLVELFETFDELQSEDVGLLISSLYYNFHFKNYSPLIIDNINGNYMLRLISQNPDPKVFAKYVAGKKFLNNSENGYNKILIDYLNKNFPEKSRFEV